MSGIAEEIHSDESDSSQSRILPANNQAKVRALALAHHLASPHPSLIDLQMSSKNKRALMHRGLTLLREDHVVILSKKVYFVSLTNVERIPISRISSRFKLQKKVDKLTRMVYGVIS
jgi:hypothetical protein